MQHASGRGEQVSGAGPLRAAGRVSRRAAVAAMGAAAVAYAVLGPRGAREAPPGRVVLDYWEKWTGQEGDAMRRVVDRFNRSQDRIYVRYFSLSAIEQKSMVSIAGGDPPDVLGLWNFSLPAFAESGALLPLDALDEAYRAELAPRLASYGGESGWPLRPERYARPALDLLLYKGTPWGAVSTCSSMALYYSRSAFAGAGLDPDRPPRTIAELDQTADRLTSVGPRGELLRAGFVHREPGWWDWIWGYFFGGDLLDAAATRATAGAPENIRAYEWLQTYPERIGASRLLAFQSGFGNYNSVQQALLGGKVAMALHGPFLANVVQTFRPDFDYGAAPFPVEESLYDPERPIALLEADVLCVPRGCKRPREALEFIAFTQRRECLEALARDHAKPSPLADVSPGFVASHPNRWIAMHNGLVRSARAFPKPPTRVWSQYEAEFITKMGAMWDLRVDAATALREIQARAQGFIDLAAERSRRRYGDRALTDRIPQIGEEP
ncbi:MAG TPA: extracellular solute-binding protein [Phycisphaerales bacterium]|nr:extracellular solute-binding protein [Phycisphaerales bacterium]